MNKAKVFFPLLLILFLLTCCATRGNSPLQNSVYNDRAQWAYFEREEDSPIDLFFIAPTVATKGGDVVTEYTEKYYTSFVGALNMEKGIFDQGSRTFAPFYHQATLAPFTYPEEEKNAILDSVYPEIREAFLYYLTYENQRRPFLLAGFSQGAEMCLRLMKEFGGTEIFQESLIACYAIGWKVTEEDVKAYPHLKMATGEKENGVIIVFSSEDPDNDHSIIIGKDEKSYAINPLSWTTGNELADKSLNKGACFTNYSGEITKEIPAFTGCYIDEKRGTLKVTDVDMEEYPAGLSVCEPGIYHIYDYQFFYRNLEENVKVRTENFLNKL